MEENKEIKYEVKKSIGTIGTSTRGWTKELNYVSWNEREPKYDIREWSPDHDKMGKGITFTSDEMLALKSLIKDLKVVEG